MSVYLCYENRVELSNEVFDAGAGDDPGVVATEIWAQRWFVLGARVYPDGWIYFDASADQAAVSRLRSAMREASALLRTLAAMIAPFSVKA